MTDRRCILRPVNRSIRSCSSFLFAAKERAELQKPLEEHRRLERVNDLAALKQAAFHDRGDYGMYCDGELFFFGVFLDAHVSDDARSLCQLDRHLAFQGAPAVVRKVFGGQGHPINPVRNPVETQKTLLRHRRESPSALQPPILPHFPTPQPSAQILDVSQTFSSSLRSTSPREHVFDFEQGRTHSLLPAHFAQLFLGTASSGPNNCSSARGRCR